ncbi:hypothetical protein AnigIFM60653_000822 [Aspergillus niger]|nr:hypothetical protein AnigIFM60653_000822 [Aspergillus niger]GLA44330.1 hypothetical protein AnigIFM63309_002918 [Aspergillus niger]
MSGVSVRRTVLLPEPHPFPPQEEPLCPSTYPIRPQSSSLQSRSPQLSVWLSRRYPYKNSAPGKIDNIIFAFVRGSGRWFNFCLPRSVGVWIFRLPRDLELRFISDMPLEVVEDLRTVVQFQQFATKRASHPSFRNRAKVLIDKGFSQFFRAARFDMMLEVEMRPMGKRLIGAGWDESTAAIVQTYAPGIEGIVFHVDTPIPDRSEFFRTLLSGAQIFLLRHVAHFSHERKRRPIMFRDLEVRGCRLCDL